jgi:putative transposase
VARVPRNELPDGIFHVTTRGVDGLWIYRDAEDRRTFLDLLGSVVRHRRWYVHALCLMGNHYHVIVESTRDRLSLGMHRLNGVYALRFNKRHGRTGHLFGDRFSSHVIDSDEYLANACLYVVNNPVRAGVCAHARDWPWSASRYGLDDA